MGKSERLAFAAALALVLVLLLVPATRTMLFAWSVDIWQFLASLPFHIAHLF